MFAIQVSGVFLKIRSTQILTNVSVTIPTGEILGLVGQNGSGKSMLMKCICGFIKPNNGIIEIFGVNYCKKGRFPDSVGFLIETPGFIERYSGYENLFRLACIQKRISREGVIAAIQRVGLDPLSRRPVGKYSLGMKQRLGIAQAFMENPKLLLLDEPMNGLDKQGVNDIRELIMELKRNGTTVLLTSHNPEDIEVLCDHVCEMEAGKLSQIR